MLFKTGEALERSGKVDIFVFDKTGTITEGQASVIDVLLGDDDRLRTFLDDRLPVDLMASGQRVVSEKAPSEFTETVTDQLRLSFVARMFGSAEFASEHILARCLVSYASTTQPLALPDKFEVGA